MLKDPTAPCPKCGAGHPAEFQSTTDDYARWSCHPCGATGRLTQPIRKPWTPTTKSKGSKFSAPNSRCVPPSSGAALPGVSNGVGLSSFGDGAVAHAIQFCQREPRNATQSSRGALRP